MFIPLAEQREQAAPDGIIVATRIACRERSGRRVCSRWSARSEVHMARRSHVHWRSGSMGSSRSVPPQISSSRHVWAAT